MDDKLAASYVGKTLLIGITYLEHDGTFIEQKQFYGIIVRTNEREGIVVELNNSGEDFKLPPALHTLQPAPKGDYHLRATSEVVIDPDFLTTWIVDKSELESGE